jgi:hypothetical protein
MAPKKAPVTSSRTRQERIKNRGKAPASTPKPRRTAAGNRGAQKGPLKPGTRTSGTPMVNSRSATMRRIQAKASAARSRAQGQPGIKGPIKLPNSQRAGVNLPKVGAGVVKPPAGQMNPVQSALLKAQGAAAKADAQAKRGAKAAMSSMSNTLATRGTVRPGRPVGGPGRGAVGGAIEQAASAALGPLVRKAGTALGQGPLKKLGRAIDDRLPGINSKDELKRKTAASKAANAKGPVQGPGSSNTMRAFDKKTFDQAFKAARTAKAKTFTWKGNKYNTKVKGEK